ncbi:hypothetical protein MMC20_006542 [Loxospora ochrophaea]|nr:hypothetical protein [Loxospora ochrophaea]
MASRHECVRLARSLPPRLLRFFARYPPPTLSPSHHPQPLNTSTLASTITALNTSSADPNANQREASVGLPTTSTQEDNPFRWTKHPITGNWHNPVYSLRRQADLVKMARSNGLEELLPLTVKGTQERTRKREESGLRTKGTGVGQRVKGKGRERTLKGRLEQRRQAMLQMPLMIRTWKQLGRGRGWKKWPK